MGREGGGSPAGGMGEGVAFGEKVDLQPHFNYILLGVRGGYDVQAALSIPPFFQRTDLV